MEQRLQKLESIVDGMRDALELSEDELEALPRFFLRDCRHKPEHQAKVGMILNAIQQVRTLLRQGGDRFGQSRNMLSGTPNPVRGH
jgi:hypothetical protein